MITAEQTQFTGQHACPVTEQRKVFLANLFRRSVFREIMIMLSFLTHAKHSILPKNREFKHRVHQAWWECFPVSFNAGKDDVR